MATVTETGPSAGTSAFDTLDPPWKVIIGGGSPERVPGALPSSRSAQLVPLLVVRAERLYGIARAKVEARIRGQKWPPRREQGSRPLGILGGLPVEWIVGDGNGRLRRDDDDIMSGWVWKR